MSVQPLEPAPDSVADLVRRLVTDWPDQGVDPLPLLERLGFAVVARDHGRPHVGEFTQLTTPVPNTTGLLLRRPNGDVGLSLFAGFATGGIPQSGRGFRALLDLLSAHDEPPAKRWGSPEEPACCWHRDGVLVELYARRRPAPDVQIGISRDA